MTSFLLALDQLINGAAKCHYMYGGQINCPIVIRLIIGRGWGQGPTHSQSLQAWFAHIPGLKVVMPTFAEDAYWLLKESIQDPNPVVFLEHRWLHDTEEMGYSDIIKMGMARICKNGDDCTIVSNSYLTIEAIKAANYLEKKHNIKCDVIDIASIKPLDKGTAINSVKKTGRLVVLDTGFEFCGLSSEIISMVCTERSIDLKAKPVKYGMQDIPEPTSQELTKSLYINAKDIVSILLTMFEINTDEQDLKRLEPPQHDIPGDWFKGPF